MTRKTMFQVKTGKNKIKSLILSTTWIVFNGFLYADPSVSSRVSANEMTLNGAITLTVDISGVNNVGSAPSLTIPDFQVQRAGQTSSFQWINGQSSALISFNYLLSPLKTGTFQIPSITLNVNGQTYSTDPMEVTVHPDPPGSAGTQNQFDERPSKSVPVPTEGLKPVFMTASVDSNKAYVGEQVLLKIQFLRRPEVRLVSQPRYVEPDMTGFLVEQLQQQEYRTTLNGTQYEVTELSYALFPTSDGEFTIGSSQIEIAVRRQHDPFDPNSFFQSFFGRSEVARLTTRAIPIQVRSLPKNKPVQFSGSVGRFKIKAKTDNDQLEVGKPFNLIITIEGVGNINAIKEPFVPELRGFRRYETLSSSKISKEGKFIHGTKEFKVLLIPQVSGPLTIPPISFVYFNPTQNDYVIELTREISFLVKPGVITETEPDLISSNRSQDKTSEGIRVVEKDIRFLKSGSLHRISPPPYGKSWVLIASGLPPLFSLVALLAQIQNRRKKERPAAYRSRRAFGKAKRGLNKAKKSIHLSDTTVFYGVIYSALMEFLADKFDGSPSGLKWEEVGRKLLDKKVEPPMIDQLKEILDLADMARFATSSFSDENRPMTLKKAEGLLILLNKLL